MFMIFGVCLKFASQQSIKYWVYVFHYVQAEAEHIDIFQKNNMT